MAKGCRVNTSSIPKKPGDYNIVNVLAENGNLSELFLSLSKLGFVENEKEALELYAYTQTSDFKRAFKNLVVDENNEPILYYQTLTSKSKIIGNPTTESLRKSYEQDVDHAGIMAGFMTKSGKFKAFLTNYRHGKRETAPGFIQDLTNRNILSPEKGPVFDNIVMSKAEPIRDVKPKKLTTKKLDFISAIIDRMKPNFDGTRVYTTRQDMINYLIENGTKGISPLFETSAVITREDPQQAFQIAQAIANKKKIMLREIYGDDFSDKYVDVRPSNNGRTQEVIINIPQNIVDKLARNKEARENLENLIEEEIARGINLDTLQDLGYTNLQPLVLTDGILYGFATPEGDIYIDTELHITDVVEIPETTEDSLIRQIGELEGIEQIGPEKAAPVLNIVSRIASNIAKRLGISNNEYAERIRLKTIKEPIDKDSAIAAFDTLFSAQEVSEEGETNILFQPNEDLSITQQINELFVPQVIDNPRGDGQVITLHGMYYSNMNRADMGLDARIENTLWTNNIEEARVFELADPLETIRNFELHAGWINKIKDSIPSVKKTINQAKQVKRTSQKNFLDYIKSHLQKEVERLEPGLEADIDSETVRNELITHINEIKTAIEDLSPKNYSFPSERFDEEYGDVSDSGFGFTAGKKLDRLMPRFTDSEVKKINLFAMINKFNDLKNKASKQEELIASQLVESQVSKALKELTSNISEGNYFLSEFTVQHFNREIDRARRTFDNTIVRDWQMRKENSQDWIQRVREEQEQQIQATVSYLLSNNDYSNAFKLKFLSSIVSREYNYDEGTETLSSKRRDKYSYGPMFEPSPAVIPEVYTNGSKSTTDIMDDYFYHFSKMKKEGRAIDWTKYKKKIHTESNSGIWYKFKGEEDTDLLFNASALTKLYGTGAWCTKSSSVAKGYLNRNDALYMFVRNGQPSLLLTVNTNDELIEVGGIAKNQDIRSSEYDAFGDFIDSQKDEFSSKDYVDYTRYKKLVLSLMDGEKTLFDLPEDDIFFLSFVKPNRKDNSGELLKVQKQINDQQEEILENLGYQPDEVLFDDLIIDSESAIVRLTDMTTEGNKTVVTLKPKLILGNLKVNTDSDIMSVFGTEGNIEIRFPNLKKVRGNISIDSGSALRHRKKRVAYNFPKLENFKSFEVTSGNVEVFLPLLKSAEKITSLNPEILLLESKFHLPALQKVDSMVMKDTELEAPSLEKIGNFKINYRTKLNNIQKLETINVLDISEGGQINNETMDYEVTSSFNFAKLKNINVLNVSDIDLDLKIPKVRKIRNINTVSKGKLNIGHDELEILNFNYSDGKGRASGAGRGMFLNLKAKYIENLRLNAFRQITLENVGAVKEFHVNYKYGNNDNEIKVEGKEPAIENFYIQLPNNDKASRKKLPFLYTRTREIPFKQIENVAYDVELGEQSDQIAFASKEKNYEDFYITRPWNPPSQHNIVFTNLKELKRFQGYGSGSIDFAALEKIDKIELDEVINGGVGVTASMLNFNFPKLKSADKIATWNSKNISFPELENLNYFDTKQAVNIQFPKLKEATGFTLLGTRDIHVPILKELRGLEINNSIGIQKFPALEKVYDIRISTESPKNLLYDKYTQAQGKNVTQTIAESAVSADVILDLRENHHENSINKLNTLLTMVKENKEYNAIKKLQYYLRARKSGSYTDIYLPALKNIEGRLYTSTKEFDSTKLESVSPEIATDIRLGSPRHGLTVILPNIETINAWYLDETTEHFDLYNGVVTKINMQDNVKIGNFFRSQFDNKYFNRIANPSVEFGSSIIEIGEERKYFTINDVNNNHVSQEYGVDRKKPDHQFQGTAFIPLMQDERAAIVKKDKYIAMVFSEKKADVTSPIHEFTHAYEDVLTDQEIAKIEAWSGHKKGTTEFSEAFALGGERYIWEGAVFNEDINGIFAKFKKWFRELIDNAVKYFGSINDLNDDMRNIYAQMLMDDYLTEKQPTQPSAEPLRRTVRPSRFQIKPGVKKLFESNPELANQVYEELQLGYTLTDDTEKGIKLDMKKPIITLRGVVIDGNTRLRTGKDVKELKIDSFQDLKNNIRRLRSIMSKQVYRLVELYDSIKNKTVNRDYWTFQSYDPNDRESQWAEGMGYTDIPLKEQLTDEELFDNLVRQIHRDAPSLGRVTTPAQKEQAQITYSRFLQRKSKTVDSKFNIEEFREFLKQEQVAQLAAEAERTEPKSIENTAIHEFGHLWLRWAKKYRNDLYTRGLELTNNSEYLKEVQESRFYADKSLEEQQDEALARAIGDQGEQFINEQKRNSFKEWLKELWQAVKNALGISDFTPEQVQNADLGEFARAVAIDLLKEDRTFNRIEPQPGIQPMVVGLEGAKRLDALGYQTQLMINIKTAAAKVRIMDAQQIAEDMEAEGKSMKAIKLHTMWEKDAAGEWVYELNELELGYKISDLLSTIIADKKFGKIIKAEDAFEYKALFDAYPDLKNFTVELQKSLDNGAAIDEKNKKIYIYKNNRAMEFIDRYVQIKNRMISQFRFYNAKFGVNDRIKAEESLRDASILYNYVAQQKDKRKDINLGKESDILRATKRLFRGQKSRYKEAYQTVLILQDIFKFEKAKNADEALWTAALHEMGGNEHFIREDLQRALKKGGAISDALLHELTHFVQKQEGYEPGASSIPYKHMTNNEIKEYLQRIMYKFAFVGEMIQAYQKENIELSDDLKMIYQNPDEYNHILKVLVKLHEEDVDPGNPLFNAIFKHENTAAYVAYNRITSSVNRYMPSYDKVKDILGKLPGGTPNKTQFEELITGPYDMANEIYKRVLGELQANVVSKRRLFTERTRRTTLFSETTPELEKLYKEGKRELFTLSNDPHSGKILTATILNAQTSTADEIINRLIENGDITKHCKL